MMTWEDIVTNYNEQYRKEIDIDNHIVTYVRSRVLKLTLESMPLIAWR
ncbi:hypothetical protein AAJ76_820009440 [Vairimorpha ceranae]|uniref:Uncharacterized protein n=1 Tax=Vairimorpha ceranae TaxID=40302 RepID=A0A0F9WBS7_9MICR|nr:hypothetical protein AAJ76_820009440 [Vairimorpha ceranae]KKO74330.1 hypothetical protein AAJ76_820009440 [Vairimorpha ceranae]